MRQEKEKELEDEEEMPDFSSIGKTSHRNSSGITTQSYNRKVLTYSELLGEVCEVVSGREVNEIVTAHLLNTIGDHNKKAKAFLVKNKNFTREFGKPNSITEANQNIAGINKVRKFFQEKLNIPVSTIPAILELKTSEEKTSEDFHIEK